MALVGKLNEEKIWNYLKSKGLNDYACAGIMGNLYAESGLKPENLQNTFEKKLGYTDESYVNAVDDGSYTNFIKDSAGFGIAQWTYWSRKKALYEYAKLTKRSIGDLEMQLDFFYKELSENYQSVFNTLKTANSVLQASNVILLKYEKPANQSTAVQNKRADYGKGYFEKYASNLDNGDDSTMGTYIKGKSVNLTANFESTEFDCNGKGCCSETKVDEKLIEYLQKIRDHFGKPVTINSAYRCAKHNKKIGGASKSKHLYGQAADIKVSGVKPLKVAQYAESIGIKGIGQYSNFVHIDTRENKYFWYGDEQKSKSTFGKYTDVTGNTANNQLEAEQPIKNEGISSDDECIVVTGSSVNIRKGPGTKYALTGKTAKAGQTFQKPDTKDWHPIIVDDEVCWISAKYAKIK